MNGDNPTDNESHYFEEYSLWELLLCQQHSRIYHSVSSFGKEKYFVEDSCVLLCPNFDFILQRSSCVTNIMHIRT